MFKCLDCEKIYKEKPDYCDCGNNLFEEIISKPTIAKSQKPFFEQYPQIKKFIDSCDILSTAIFLICILLSVLVLIFVQPSSQVVQNSSQTNNQIITKNIPTIEQLWLNEVEKTQNQDVLIKNTPKQIKQPIINQVIKKTKNNSTQKIEKQKENKPKEQILVIQQTEVQQRQETPQIKNENINQDKTATKEEEIKAQKKSKEDWNNYKVALRQALFNNLAVTSVVGSGECVIEFAIQKDGKIIQRSFSSQSPNETVNQSVYNMMMKLPYYYAPPSFYNGDKIKMKFLFKNGAYEISYI